MRIRTDGEDTVTVHLDRLVKHLKAQIKAAEKLQSDWVYITLPQAEKCLEIALNEAEREKKDDDKGIQ